VLAHSAPWRRQLAAYLRAGRTRTRRQQWMKYRLVRRIATRLAGGTLELLCCPGGLSQKILVLMLPVRRAPPLSSTLRSTTRDGTLVSTLRKRAVVVVVVMGMRRI
jgi:hypothetical protein